MRIGKIQQKTLDIISTYQEFELLEYKRGQSAKVKLKCLRCGTVFERYAHHFNNYPHVCPNCNPKNTANKISLLEAQKRVDEVYGEDVLKIIDYSGNNSLSNIECLKCGKTFQAVPVSLWRNRSKGCPNCNKTTSLGELALKSFFERQKIQYVYQYRFPDCKDIMPLPFDFYLPQFNVAVEFQGEQHYKKESFYYSENVMRHDAIKKNYCLNNQILLIVIPYWDIEKIPKYFNFLKND